MKKHLILSFIALLSIFSAAQKNYLVIYDKLANTTEYREIRYERGRPIEKIIKCPSVDAGDVVTFRCINTNEFVFDVNLGDEEVIESQHSNALSNLAQMINPFGFSGPLGNVADLLSNSNLDNGIYMTRGDEAESAEMTAIRSEFIDLNDELTEVIEEYKKIKNIAMVVYAEDKTLEEIKADFNVAKKSINLNSYNNKKVRLANHKSEIDSILEDNESLIDIMDVSYKNILESVEKFQEFYADEVNLKSIQNRLDNLDFVSEKTVVIENHYANEGRGGSISKLEYLISFNTKSFDQDGGETKTKMCKSVSFPVKGALSPSWVAGVAWVSPFVEVNTFQIKQVGIFQDSLMISATPATGGKLALSTMMDFRLTQNTNVIPSINIGAAARPKSGGSFGANFGNISFLLGSSVRFKSFPYLSFTGGVSFTEVQMLKSEYTLGNSFLAPDGYISNDDNNMFLEFKYKPGYYLGVNFNF